jgi:hypothetical protein
MDTVEVVAGGSLDVVEHQLLPDALGHGRVGHVYPGQRFGVGGPALGGVRERAVANAPLGTAQHLSPFPKLIATFRASEAPSTDGDGGDADSDSSLERLGVEGRGRLGASPTDHRLFAITIWCTSKATNVVSTIVMIPLTAEAAKLLLSM